MFLCEISIRNNFIAYCSLETMILSVSSITAGLSVEPPRAAPQHTHTHTQSLSHTHTSSLSISHTLALLHKLSHTHTHTVSLSHTHKLSLYLTHTLSLTQTLSHTHTHTHTHTHFIGRSLAFISLSGSCVSCHTLAVFAVLFKGLNMLMEAMCVKYQNNESLSSNDLSLNRSVVDHHNY